MSCLVSKHGVEKNKPMTRCIVLPAIPNLREQFPEDTPQPSHHQNNKITTIAHTLEMKLLFVCLVGWFLNVLVNY